MPIPEIKYNLKKNHLLEIDEHLIDTSTIDHILDLYWQKYPEMQTLGWLEHHFVSWLNLKSGLLLTNWRLRKNMLPILGHSDLTQYVVEQYQMPVYDFEQQLPLTILERI